MSAAITTGINGLPVEILGYIFSLTARDSMRTSSMLGLGSYLPIFNVNSEHHRNRAPFVFLQVCHQWRIITEAMPLLWTALDVTTHKAVTRTSTLTAALEHWLSLSQFAPLDFFLQTTNRSDDVLREVSSAHAVAMLRVLAKHAHRWRSVALNANAHLARAFVDIALHRLSHAPLPGLKRLEIYAFDTEAPIEDVARAIASIKPLVELHLAMHRGDYRLSFLEDISWSQLTTICIGMPLTVDQVAFLLSQSTAAVAATLKFIYGPPVSTSGAEQSIVPVLKSLMVDGSDSLLSLFDHFDFPHLEQLHITSDSLACHCQAVQRLIGIVQSPVRRLTSYVHARVSASELAKYLSIRRLHRVSDVEVYAWNILKVVTEAVVQAIQLEDDIPVWWSWRTASGGQYVGWKSKFDRSDKEVACITPASTNLQ